MKKLLFLIFVLLILFSVKTSAAHTDLYSEQYEQSGADSLSDSLPDDTKEYLKDFGADIYNYNWVNSITYENVFSHILGFVKSGARLPLLCGGGILSVILISAALSSYSSQSSVIQASLYAATLSAAAIVCVPLFSAITATVNAMKGCSAFMSGLIPVFASIIAAGGMPLTSVSMSSLLLGASQAVSYASNFIVTPLLGGYLSISVASAVSPVLNQTGIASAIKKTAMWIMSLIATVFTGILSIQTVVNASADSLSLKTAKFILGSSVPITGSALSEALNTVTASVGLLKSSVAVYGVVAALLIFLPLLLELLIWRGVLNLTSAAAECFLLAKISALLKSFDTVISLLIGVILTTAAMFIISLSVVLTLGKA